MKHRILRFLTLFLSLVLGGCIHSTVRIGNVRELPAGERVTLTTDSKDVSVQWVGDKKVTTLRKLWDNKWDAEVHLPPGEHEVQVQYSNNPLFDGFKQPVVSHFLLTINGVAGRAYQVKHRVSERSAKVWVEDQSGGTSGKIIATYNELADDPDEIFDQSMYFTMALPEGTGWIIPQRNLSMISFVRKGNGEDESYAVMVKRVEIPKLETKEDFLGHLKTERAKDGDADRFSRIQDDYGYLDGREDYCISYRSAAEDRKATKRSDNKAPMILEMVGFFCRHPQNKNTGIFFEYSHRHYAGDQDTELAEKASRAFDRLKF